MNVDKVVKGLRKHIDTPIKLPKPTKDRPDDKIKQIAIDVLDNKVFTDRHLQGYDANLVTSVFMPIIFMDKKMRLQLQADGPGLIFEYYGARTQAARGINGYPMFASMQYLTTSEAKKFWKFYEEEKAKRGPTNGEAKGEPGVSGS